jgi:membrane fusion protein, copper/silver efflux system
MKQLRSIAFVFILTILGCSSDDGHQNHERHKQQEVKKIYTCPMHPQIIRDKPGQCPICGMNLVEKKSEGESNQDTTIKFLLKPTNQYVLSRIKTIGLLEKEVPTEFTATGNITYDTKMINTVSARTAGRIERLYVKYRFQSISKGEKLMDIYSKDLITEQENYIYLLNNDCDNQVIINAAENKLILLGLNKEQIGEIKKLKKVKKSITIYSPYSGHLHDMQPAKRVGEMDGEKVETQELAFHEGMYVEKGQTIFNIYSTDKVWAVLNIYPEKQALLKKDQKVKLFIDGVKDSVIARVDFIEPVIRADQKTISARVYLNNSDGAMKIGVIVKAIVLGEKRKGLFVPTTAVISLGLNDVVFVFRNKLFEAIPVKLGRRTDEWIEVLSGLKKSEHVAENAQLLMDSESFIKINK